MKKFFGQDRESEEIQEYGGEAEYEEELEYYEEEPEYVEESEYYEEEPEYVEESEYYEEEPEHVEESEYYEEDPEYYEDAEYEDEMYEDEEKSRSGIFTWFTNMTAMDRVMLCTGVGVVILAIITGIVFLNAKISKGQLSELAAVGTQLEGIEIIGDEGLLAVADARIARMEALKLLEKDENGYEEAEYNKSVTVTLKTVSVQKDLKIKFVNKDTDKLISNVPFVVTITTPDNKSEIWEDDDMDGIIYKKGITPGNYQVKVNELNGDSYKRYTLPTDVLKAEVRKDIAYKKVDVSDEVKTESQVDLSQEEQRRQEMGEESSLPDTVEWVESTAVTSSYIEVSKSSIPDPMVYAKSGSFLRMANEVKLSQTTAEMKVNGKTLKLTASYSLDNVVSVGWNSSDANVADVDVDGVVTAVSAGTATISCTVTATKETSEGTEDIDYVGTCEVTVRDDSESESTEPETSPSTSEKGSISLDKTAVTVYIGSPVSIKASLKNTSDDEVTAKTSDKNIATVETDGQSVTITGVKAGTATVTVSAETDDGTISATCAVTVKENPKNDANTPLKDGSGNQIYVQEGDSYRAAVAADYYKDGVKYFKKGETKYTGWQTIDGKVYFFDKTGKKVTGEQVIQGAKYTFASDGSLVTGSGTMGIDVSKHNGNIDWNAVKNSGVSYVIIRCGYRGYTQGSLIVDPKFEQNIKGATSAGLKVGVYFFSQAVDEVEAVQEASFVLDAVKNYKISYPIFLDVEYSGAAGNTGRADGLNKAARTAVCRAFCATIQSGGYTAGVYANKSWLETMIDPGQLGSYKIWLAQYAASPTYTGRYDMWQYKSTGKVSGISGNVDMNLSYMGY